jgi:hypothetical protein
MERFLWRLIVVMGLTHLVWTENMSFNVGYFSTHNAWVEQKIGQWNANIWEFFASKPDKSPKIFSEGEVINNTTFIIDPKYAARCGVPHAVVSRSMGNCKRFVKKMGPIAVAEMRNSGVPASILLAQALLESDAGENLMAQKNNHFFLQYHLQAHRQNGKSKGNKTVKIPIFNNLWGSFREQSILLANTAPFSPLVHSGEKDYRVWVRTLVNSGYTYDAYYGKAIQALIQALQLDNLDNRKGRV